MGAQKEERKKHYFYKIACLKNCFVRLLFFMIDRTLELGKKIPIPRPSSLRQNPNLKSFQITLSPLYVPIAQACLTVTFRPHPPPSQAPSSILPVPPRGYGTLERPCNQYSHKVVENSPWLSEHKYGHYATPYFPLGVIRDMCCEVRLTFPFIPRFNLMCFIHHQK